MTKRADWDPRRQRAALMGLRERSGRTRTQIAALVGMEGDTYRRLETAVHELRVSQIPALELAYRVEPGAIFAALGLAGLTQAARTRPERAAFAPALDRDLASGVASVYSDPEVASRVIEYLLPLPREMQQAFLELSWIAEYGPSGERRPPQEPEAVRAAAGA